MTISTDDLGRITQQTAVLDRDGDRLGTVDQVYTSDVSGDPAWVTLRTGRFGSQESFVPLADASLDGDDVRVSVTKEAVHGAPRVDAGGHLGVEEEDDLYRYYGLTNPDHDPDEVADAATGTVPSDHDHDADHDHDRDADDEVAAVPVTAPRRAETTDPDGSDGSDGSADDDRTVAAENGPELAEPAGGRTDAGPTAAEPAETAVRPGERTTRLRRYVVTERVVQTIEELPEDDPR